MRALALLTLIVCPLSALAQEESPPPRWSLGAGVSTTVIYSSCSTSSLNGGLLCPMTRGPSAGASLERRLSDSTWLLLGATGSFSDSRDELTVSGGETTTTHWRSQQVFVDLGVRHLLTGRGALVDVSLLAAAQGGYDEANGTRDDGADSNASSWILGASMGLALDRALADGLTVRVATPLAGVWWQRSRQELAESTLRSRALTAAVYLAPRLELRLAF